VSDYATGRSRPVLTPGDQAYLPYFARMDVFDKSPVEYTLSGNEHLRHNKAPRLVVRARNGSSYGFDRVSIQYALDSSALERGLVGAGPGEAFKQRFVNAYARSILRDEFGRFGAEEIDLAQNKRTATARAKQRLAAALAPHGLVVLELSTGKPSFPKVYEQTMQRRKVAEEETQSLIEATRQLQQAGQQISAQVEKQQQLVLERQRSELASELEAAQRQTVLSQHAADVQFAERELAGRMVREDKLAQAKWRADGIEKEAQARRETTAALEAQGAGAVRAALARTLAGVTFELAPFVAPVREEQR
jgi:hypothetical protein